MQLEVTVLRQAGTQLDELEDAPTGITELVRKAVQAAATVAGEAGAAGGPGACDSIAARARNEVAVVLTDDAGISQYHKQYLGDDSPTDVISFASGDACEEPGVSGGPGDSSIGDIVVSTDTARTQARQYGHSEEREICLLVIHGFLHLVGYDDTADGPRQKMREAEARALSLM